MASDTIGASVSSATKRLCSSTISLGVALVLSSCSRDAKIDVHTIDGVTTFAVSGRNGSVACVQNIGVSEGHGETGSISKWRLNQNYADIQAGKSACLNDFVYGQPIAGYQQTYDGKPLESGKTYYVSVSGGGLSADRTFTVDQ